MLRKLYDWMMNLAGHKHARLALAGVSFAESSFFPIPPDPLYLAMALQDRKNVWNLAILCTITSVVGGYLGYFIGWGLYESIGKTIIEFYGAGAKFDSLMKEYSFLISNN